MDILYLLVPLSLAFVFAIGLVFRWSLKAGQFDDLEGPAHRILMDDDGPPGADASAPADPGGNRVYPSRAELGIIEKSHEVKVGRDGG